jgi:hypothetical protein
MKYLYIALFAIIYLTVSTMDYNDQVSYYASNDQQGYEQAFIVPCDTDTDCMLKNPHIKED